MKFRTIVSARMLLGCMVLTCLTSDGVFGHVAIRMGAFAMPQSYFWNVTNVQRIVQQHADNPDIVRVKARQL